MNNYALSLFLILLLSILVLYLIYKVKFLKKQYQECQNFRNLYYSLFNEIPLEIILLKDNEIMESNKSALETLGVNLNIDKEELKERMKRSGKYFEIKEIPIKDKYKMIVLLDITEKESLKEAYKIALSYLSHELKTPLAIASGYLERLGIYLLESESNEEIKELYYKIENAFKRLEKLLTKLFSSIEYLAKDIKFSKEPFNLKEALDEAIFWVTPLAEEKGVTLQYKIEEDITLYGSVNLFIQALFNLIENAVKVSSKGQCVIIKAFYITSEKISITIRDFGPGLPPEKLNFLGQPFFKLREGEGMGLGLFIAKKVIEAHNGKLNFYLPSDGGLEVNLIIPINGSSIVNHQKI